MYFLCYRISTNQCSQRACYCRQTLTVLASATRLINTSRPERYTFYHRRGNLRGQLRGGALSLQRTTLRTSRHPAHRAHPNTPPALLSALSTYAHSFFSASALAVLRPLRLSSGTLHAGGEVGTTPQRSGSPLRVYCFSVCKQKSDGSLLVWLEALPASAPFMPPPLPSSFSVSHGSGAR